MIYKNIKNNDPEWAEKHLWNAIGFPLVLAVLFVIFIAIPTLLFLYE